MNENRGAFWNGGYCEDGGSCENDVGLDWNTGPGEAVPHAYVMVAAQTEMVGVPIQKLGWLIQMFSTRQRNVYQKQ